MTTFTAIALDPGGTTGWAYYRATHMSAFVEHYGATMPDEWYDETWESGHLTGDHMDDLLLLLETNHTAEYHVISERYIERPGKIGAKHEPAPRYNTVAEMFTRERDVPLYMQMSSVKNFVKDSNIKKLGLWSPGHKHAMDAMRHLLFWLIHGQYRRVDLVEKGWRF